MDAPWPHPRSWLGCDHEADRHRQRPPRSTSHFRYICYRGADITHLTQLRPEGLFQCSSRRRWGSLALTGLHGQEDSKQSMPRPALRLRECHHDAGAVPDLPYSCHIAHDNEKPGHEEPSGHTFSSRAYTTAAEKAGRRQQHPPFTSIPSQTAQDDLHDGRYHIALCHKQCATTPRPSSTSVHVTCQHHGAVTGAARITVNQGPRLSRR